MRLCTIDVGTNTVQSLVADVTLDGGLAVVADEERFARLGQGVDASGRLADEAMDRVVDRLAQAQATAVRLGAERTLIAATSASRDAANVGVLQARVRDALGLDYRVVSGAREAALSFRGALAMCPGVDAAVVVDIGGGSTEVVAGDRRALGFRVSLDVGSVRLTERRFASRPPTAAMVAAAEADVAAALASVPRALLAPGVPLLATGSVARLFARLAGALGTGGGALAVPAPVVPATAIRAWRDRALALAPADLLAVAPDVLAGREDVAAAAVLVLRAVLAHLGADGYVATPGGLRHGLALDAVRPARGA